MAPKSINLADNFVAGERKRIKRWISQNIVFNPKHNGLHSWSWGSIQDVYAILGKQLKNHEAYRNRCNIPQNIDINFSDHDNTFIIRFWRDVNRIDAHLQMLDTEIARRNNLIGVI